MLRKSTTLLAAVAATLMLTGVANANPFDRNEEGYHWEDSYTVDRYDTVQMPVNSEGSVHDTSYEFDADTWYAQSTILTPVNSEECYFLDGYFDLDRETTVAAAEVNR